MVINLLKTSLFDTIRITAAAANAGIQNEIFRSGSITLVILNKKWKTSCKQLKMNQKRKGQIFCYVTRFITSLVY